MTSPILVTGATGNIGRHVVTGLHARGLAVRAMSRAVPTDLPAGVEPVRADFTDPGSLTAALDGVAAVFLLWPSLSADGVAEVATAIADHARHVVHVSAMHVRDDRTPEENGVWGRVEAAVRDTGVDWTFLRASGFATNTLAWAAAVRSGAPVRIPYPEAARSLIHERDIAEVAVRALTEDGHAGAAHVLTGPAAITQAEQVRILGEVTGRPTRVAELTRAEARAEMLEWGDKAFADGALSYWASLVDTPEPVTSTVERITGSPARTFAEWARDHVADFRA
jgi:uncharacterized protein YbjT (DUF2867 family)